MAKKLSEEMKASRLAQRQHTKALLLKKAKERESAINARKCRKRKKVRV